MTQKDIDKVRKTLRKQRKKAYEIMAYLDEEHAKRFPNSPFGDSYGVKCAKHDFDNYVDWIMRELADVEKNLATVD